MSRSCAAAKALAPITAAPPAHTPAIPINHRRSVLDGPRPNTAIPPNRGNRGRFHPTLHASLSSVKSRRKPESRGSFHWRAWLPDRPTGSGTYPSLSLAVPPLAAMPLDRTRVGESVAANSRSGSPRGVWVRFPPLALVHGARAVSLGSAHAAALHPARTRLRREVCPPHNFWTGQQRSA